MNAADHMGETVTMILSVQRKDTRPRILYAESGVVKMGLATKVRGKRNRIMTLHSQTFERGLSNSIIRMLYGFIENLCKDKILKTSSVIDLPAVKDCCCWQQNTFLLPIYSSDCGHLFEFSEMGPTEQEFAHCPFCGLPLEEIPAEDEGVQDELV